MKQMNIVKNKDLEARKRIEESLEKNNFYCPCKLQKNIDTLCICKEFRESIISGFCHCKLYYKEI